MSTQTAQDLREAANVLRRDGWRNDGQAIGVDDNCRCVSQAIWFVTHDGNDYGGWSDSARADMAEAALADYLGLKRSNDIFTWNDGHETAEPVLAALEAAADAAEKA